MYGSRHGSKCPNPYLLVTRDSLEQELITNKYQVSTAIPKLYKYNTPASIHAARVLMKWLKLFDMVA